MDKLLIEGATPLTGNIEISGSKNATLPILFSTLLTEKKCTLKNVPDLMDVHTSIKLLNQLGKFLNYDSQTHTVEVESSSPHTFEAPYDLVRTMRASILVLGPMLAHYGSAKVSLPGGCSIGTRPVDLHLEALKKLGAKIKFEEGYIHAQAKKLKGALIHFKNVSVGATENTLMAATLAEGMTTISNAACEPEIVDLALFLKKIGAKIEGEGTPTILIYGPTNFQSANHTIIPDRIEAGTYLMAGAITGGNITLSNGCPEHVQATLQALKDCGFVVSTKNKTIQLKSEGPPSALSVSTAPYPGFATDMQAQLMALLSTGVGRSQILESIFENRFMHVPELLRLGADIQLQGNTAFINGLSSTGKNFSGATVMATDLRASACLVLAGLAASGKTTVRRIYHLDRGYEKLELKLQALGARVWREKE